MAAPQFDPINEIRFAVVMYGGVSLAIYINGVTQELLDLVRATAPRSAGGEDGALLLEEKELTGAMPVYRRLGQYLKANRAELDPELPRSEAEQDRWKAATVRTRFVVDVISGTSAGGINGIFLSKALANNQSLGGLKKLWVTEGDLSLLLNDKRSVADLRQYGMAVAEPQQSLLNSQRMYRKLLEALDQMEKPGDPEPEIRSPLVGELDLFVTTTDIAGLPLPIKLADKLVYERRHRNVFHFRYQDPGADEERDTDKPDGDDEVKDSNDFVKLNDPFLAYAARCTSSFPFAFEPMRLGDIKSVVKSFRSGSVYNLAPKLLKKWRKFYSEYLRRSVWDIRQELAAGGPDGAETDEAERCEELSHDFWERSFGDGGYLDNKPFSHATALLMRRTADVPVDRKLVYVEPTPEHPERAPATQERPDFLQNVQAALGLPRDETIREDLDRILERNQILERIAVLAKNVDRDVAELPFKYDNVLSPEQFENSGLAKLINLYGVGYGAYHRLKLNEITLMLAERIARAIGVDTTSEEGDVIRDVMEVWRNANFKPEPFGSLPSENKFLRKLDLRYCLRRLGFLAQRINEISQLDERALELIRIATLTAWEPTREVAYKKISELLKEEQWKCDFICELKEIKRTRVSKYLATNRVLEERLQVVSFALDASKPDVKMTLRELAAPIFTWKELEKIMTASRGKRCDIIAEFVSKHAGSFDQLEKFFCLAFKEAGGVPISDPKEDLNFHDAKVVARRVIQHFRALFPLYDLVTYPVVAGSGVGETTVVKVSRISPEDAVVLGENRQTPWDKLAGTTLMNFGAFIQRNWRQNDMLWGRLDGAERLICAVFEHQSKEEENIRRRLVIEAQMAILKDVLNPVDRETVARLVAEFVSHLEPGTVSESALRSLIAKHLGADKTFSAVDTVLRSSLKEPKQVWEFYDEGFEVDRRVDTENAVRLIARATDIVGRMLEQLAAGKKLETAGRIAKRVAMLGRIFWRTIEVAVPRSLPQLFFQHWLGILYVFDLVFILGGIVFGQAQVKNFGWLLLALTVSANLIVAVLTEYLAGKGAVLRIARFLLALLLIGLVAGGVLFVGQHLTSIETGQEFFLAGGIALLLIILVLVAEWRLGLRRLPERACEGVHWKCLWWTAGLTVLFMAALCYIGPPQMSHLELAATAARADCWMKGCALEQLRKQLVVDFGLLISYTILLATACFGASRLWQARASAVKLRPWQDRRIFSLKMLWQFLAYASLTIACLQWVAGVCDAVENYALLRFLYDRNAEIMPPIAFYAATTKFSLAILGCFCGAVGFLFGPKESGKARIAFVIVGLLFLAAGLFFGYGFIQGLRHPGC